MHVVNNFKSGTNFFKSFERGNSNTPLTIKWGILHQSFLASNGSDCAVSNMMKSNLQRMYK